MAPVSHTHTLWMGMQVLTCVPPGEWWTCATEGATCKYDLNPAPYTLNHEPYTLKTGP